MSAAPFARAVVHAHTPSPASERAFVHALALALVPKAELTLVHLERDGEPEPAPFPGVRETLSRWKLLPPGSPREAVYRELALRVRKVALPPGDPASVVPRYVRGAGADLLVLPSEPHPAPARWLRPSVAERAMRSAGAATLLLPDRGRGFVDPSTGRLSLRRILLPVDHRRSAEVALRLAMRTAETLGDPPVRLVLLHAGERFPPLEAPAHDGLRIERLPRRGHPARAVDETLRELDPDLLVLPTTPAPRRRRLPCGRSGLAEKILRMATAPVLSVPAERDA